MHCNSRRNSSRGGGGSLVYNLHIPQGYDSKRGYPLIVFIHDSSVVSSDPRNTLKQDFGALVWATPEAQQAQPSFVLAPQFDRTIANDDFQLDPQGRDTIALIEALRAKYNIDPDRIYITGQSMGCMTSFALAIEHPDLFGGILCVAGQWDPKQMAPLARQNLLYIVSQGDTKASPGMDAFETVASGEGVRPAKAIWDGRWNQQQFADALSKLEGEGGMPLLVKLTKGSVLPTGVADSPMFEHIYTWDTVYPIKAVQNWLLAQRRRPNQ